MENLCCTPHLSGARVKGATWSSLSFQSQHQRKDETICAPEKCILCACAYNRVRVELFVPGAHLTNSHYHHLKISHSYLFSIKSIADLRLGLCPFSHSQIHVSHYRHISTLYFSNSCLLIKGQSASKKKCS